MRYTRVNAVTKDLNMYNTETLERTNLSHNYRGSSVGGLASADNGIFLEYVKSDLIVLSIDKHTIDIVKDNTKYVVEFRDKLTINSRTCMTGLDQMFLYCAYKSNDKLYIEFRYEFVLKYILILEYNITTDKFSIRRNGIDFSTSLKNIGGIPCDSDAYRKRYRRLKLLESR